MGSLELDKAAVGEDLRWIKNLQPYPPEPEAPSRATIQILTIQRMLASALWRLALTDHVLQ